MILKPVTIQSFDPEQRKFDIVLLNDSINHLNEPAGINLLAEEESRNIYREIFTKISSLARSGGELIVCDCSRYNFYDFLGLKNPFAPTIEWHKHQAPERWAELLLEVGFINPKIRWTWPLWSGSIGRFFLSNRLATYFTSSHFRLNLRKA